MYIVHWQEGEGGEGGRAGFTPNLFPKKGTERFEQDFRFQLTKEEFKNLMCKNFTSRWTQTRNNTEEIRQIKQQVNDLTVVINDFTDKNIKKDYLFYNGQTVEADIAYSEIYSYAEKTIHIIDNYISLKTLVLLKSVPSGVKVTIFSDNVNHGLHQAEFADFLSEYPHVDIELRSSGGIYHDRYIFIDHATPNEMIFHCGGSSKDGGKRVSSISRVEDTVLYQNIVGSLEGNPVLQL